MLNAHMLYFLIRRDLIQVEYYTEALFFNLIPEPAHNDGIRSVWYIFLLSEGSLNIQQPPILLKQYSNDLLMMKMNVSLVKTRSYNGWVGVVGKSW